MRAWRLLKYTILLLLCAAALIWLYNHNGSVTLEWLGYRIDVQMLFFLPVILVLVTTIIMFDRLMRWIASLPERWSARHASQRRDKAYRSLMEGFTAIAAGDTAAARKLSAQAEKLFAASKEEAAPLSLLLAAQTAQLDGDEQKAQQFYRRMLTHESSEFLGLRGLLVSTMRRIPAKASPVNETLEESLELAERAYALRPHTGWLVRALVELYIKSGRWQKGERLIERAYKQRVVEQTESDRLLAIIHYHQAQVALEHNKLDEALSQAETAHKKRSTFIPATVLLIDILVRKQQQDRALKIAEKSWPDKPHPLLAKRIQQLLEKLPAEKRVKRVEKMVRQVPENIESQLLVARAAMDARQWSKARNHIKAALNEAETVKVCRLMAELEDTLFELEEGGDENIAEQWFERAHNAPPDARWVCRQCSHEYERWVVVCGECGAFDSVRWSAPGGRGVVLEQGGQSAITGLGGPMAEVGPSRVV